MAEKNKPLFERLNIQFKDADGNILKKEQIISKFYLIGLDFGDGEISASWIVLDPVNYSPKVQLLNLATIVIGQAKLMNIIRFSDDAGEVCELFHQNVGGQFPADQEYYYNYKRNPSSGAADKDYCFDKTDGNGQRIKSAYSYKELMAYGFAAVVNSIFDTNKFTPSSEKSAVILVGRPSDSSWKDDDYVTILQSKLRADWKAYIHVAVQDESVAAMASELGRNESRNRVIAVVDCGSSTFDLTIICPDGMGPVDSCPFGGRDLDDCILNYVKYKNEGVLVPPKMKPELRLKKEVVYSGNGNGSPYNYEGNYYIVQLANHDQRIFPFNEANMNEILNNPADIDSLTVSGFDSAEPYISWMKACESVFTRFKEKIEAENKRGGHKEKPMVLLSGGVSKMQPVKDLAASVFTGMEVKPASEPNFAVSMGLGRVLEIEIDKKLQMEKLWQALDEKINAGVESLKEAMITLSAESDNRCYREATNTWFEKRDPVSFKTLYSLFKEKLENSRDAAAFPEKAAIDWIKGMVLNDMLQHHFKALFPNVKGSFQVSDYSADFRELFARTWKNIQADYTIKLPAYFPYLFFDETNMNQYSGQSDTKYTIDQRRTMKQVFRSRGENALIEGWKIPDEGWGFEGGLRALYLKEFSNNNDQLIDEYRKRLRKCLRSALYDYIEKLTYYYASEKA